MVDGAQVFTAALRVRADGRRELQLPFDPAQVWGERDRYHVTGSIDGHPVRGPLTRGDGGWVLPVGSLWCQDEHLRHATDVAAQLRPEGPQREALAPDIVAAFDAAPEAAAFFDSLATFYRKGYLRWVDATKRRPDVRAARIEQMITLLSAGQKQRPRHSDPNS